MSVHEPVHIPAPHYRPFTLARQGELLAYGQLTAAQHADFTPVFMVPPREWNYDKDAYAKSVEAHLQPIPQKLATARNGAPAYIDLAFLDDETPTRGVHPLTWIVESAALLGLPLMPLVSSESTDETLKSASTLNAAQGLGIAIRLGDGEWPSQDSTILAEMLRKLGTATTEVDLFLDYGAERSSFVTAALRGEFSAPHFASAWRTITIGGHAWPKDLPTGKGVFEIERSDWMQFETTCQALFPTALRPGFFDYLVANPDPRLDVDPKLLTISASFRYTSSEAWLFVRGGLYKASGGRGKGGEAVPPALRILQAHPLYSQPIRTETDNWIDLATSGGKPGNSSVWRRWATHRHVEVTLHQLANLP